MRKRAECPRCYGTMTYKTGNVFAGVCRITGKRNKVRTEYMCYDCGNVFVVQAGRKAK